MARRGDTVVSGAADVFQQIIEQAVEVGVRKALSVSETTNRRLFSIAEGAVYLALSKREIYNLVATGEIPAVSHGRRRMLDIRDLDEWIARKKG